MKKRVFMIIMLKVYKRIKPKSLKNRIFYKEEEIKRAKETDYGDKLKTDLKVYKNYELNFVLNEPKIEFRSKTNNSNIIERSILLINVMTEFALEQEYFKTDSKPWIGHHMCLSMNNKQGGFGYLGYIHVAADRIYELHPNKKEFIESFQNNLNYSIDT